MTTNADNLSKDQHPPSPSLDPSNVEPKNGNGRPRHEDDQNLIKHPIDVQKALENIAPYNQQLDKFDRPEFQRYGGAADLPIEQPDEVKHRMYCLKSNMKCLVYHVGGVCPDETECEGCKAEGII